jgi:hypothetical protein
MVRGVPAPPSGTVKASASGSIPALPSEDEIIELGAPAGSRPQRASASKAAGAPKVKPPPLPGPLASGTPSRAAAEKAGEDEFWRITKRKP